MRINILGWVDIITAVLFFLFTIFGITSLYNTILFLGIFLLALGIISATKDAISILDIISACILITASSFQIWTLLVVLETLYLLHRGIFRQLG